MYLEISLLFLLTVMSMLCCAFVDALAPILQLVYVSDCYDRPNCEYRQMARFVFTLRKPGPETEAAARLALRLVDLFSTFALSAKGQERAKKKRLQLKVRAFEFVVVCAFANDSHACACV